jgi:DNA segregation ATPase FtsK/SpoIIIE, S-DNA-T family
MTEPSLVDRQRTLLHDLAHLAAERSQAEPVIEQEFRSCMAAENRTFEQSEKEVIVRFAYEKEQADREIREAREKIQARFEAEQTEAARELNVVRLRLTEEGEAGEEEAQSAFQESCWTINAVFEATRSKAEKQRETDEEWAGKQAVRLNAIHQEACGLLVQWRQSTETIGEEKVPEKLLKVQEYLATADEALAQLKTLILPRFLKGWRLPGLFVFLGLLLIFPLGLLVDRVAGLEAPLDQILWMGLGTSAVVTLALGLGLGTLIRSLARSRVQAIWQPLARTLAEGTVWHQHILESYENRYQRQVADAIATQEGDLGKATDAHRARMESIATRRTDGLRQAEERADRQRETSNRRQEHGLSQAEERYRKRMGEAQSRYDTESRARRESHETAVAGFKSQRLASWKALGIRWRDGSARVRAEVVSIAQSICPLFPAWSDPLWEGWTLPTSLPPALRFGEFRVRLEQIPGGVPSEEGLRKVGPGDLTLPALCDFPERASLLLEAGEGGRAEAVDLLRAMMFRMLTSLPAGKVRFTILDPVGLGQNFAAFMHLADYDPQLVASRIWTEQQHIEQRLTDLTAHMENVIQKYLRNQYQTIAEYNEQAGEVAEPFRVLVVADFPVNFTTEAARRLVSIAQSGSRCGVSTLVSVDTRQLLPAGFSLTDLEEAGATLVWQEGRFNWKDPDFGPFDLTLETPPEDQQANHLLHRVGKYAREAGRVEVPFEFIAPLDQEWWTGDSRTGLDVALGRSGATRRQHLRLGQGTSQHVLVAGKTGSGKSTLLHALITNLALRYSPDEVELYLVDFKKGVEFKTYAVHQLPHARVVAIESEREFGLSVLQRLDAELKSRGERFRETRAQDLNSYRQARPDESVPRILLIVDEFQEFFVEDDRLSQEAAQLLDRLVRQGRAFGLHILLGSQTLGGAYSLARSTIDQMAVRIALQCSEADAHLILSEENGAARLLARPGEAIYNDANGRVEGNNFFQVVWLPDERREAYLEQVHEMNNQRRAASSPPLVFEGNIPGDVSRNHLLNRLLHEPSSAGRRTALAWLGEAIAIKDPTAAPFSGQHGSNLLIVGQQDEAALGMLTTSVVSLAAQMSPFGGMGNGGERFYLVDGSPADAPWAGALGRLASVLPQTVRAGGWRDVPAIMNELAAEIERRQKEIDTEGPPIYLVLYGVQRLRDLRRQEDDFGFSRREETASPSQQFATLLREGAALGIHTLVWCDSLNNLQRSIDRQGLREFGMRVVFQMNVTDSSNLIDSPQASKLGVNRGLFVNDETGTLEKFRPYGVPSEEWLEHVREPLSDLWSTETRVSDRATS